MGECKDAKHCHDHHMCKLIKRDDLEKIKRLVKDAAYFCKKCGRAAHDKDNLCDPSKI